MLEKQRVVGPVAAYIRVSTEEQAERDTPELQRQELAKWANYEGVELVGPYFDDVSGKIPLGERPDGARLLEDASEGKFTHVVVYKLDRLARRLKVLIDERDRLQDLNVGLISIKESLNTEDYLGRLMFNILGTIAEWEVETLALRVDAGRRVKIKDGKWIGGWLPYGYQMDENQYLILCPHEARIVKEAYERYIAGETQHMILEDLNTRSKDYWHTAKVQNRGDENPDVRRVRKWNPQSFSQLFTNPIYKGEYEWGGIESEVSVPAIVSPQMFALVSERLDKYRNLMVYNDTPALASGILTCAGCGQKFYYWKRKSVTKKNGNRHEYFYNTYICGGRRFGTCRSAIIRVEELDKVLWDFADSWLANPPLDIWLAEKNKNITEEVSELSEELSVLSAEAQSLSDGKQSVLRLVRKGAITQSDLEKQLFEIAVEERELQQRIQAVRRQIHQKQDNTEHRQALLNLIGMMREKRDKGFTFQEKKRLIRESLQSGLVTTIDRGQSKKKDYDLNLEWRFDLLSQLKEEGIVDTIELGLSSQDLLHGSTIWRVSCSRLRHNNGTIPKRGCHI